MEWKTVPLLGGGWGHFITLLPRLPNKHPTPSGVKMLSGNRESKIVRLKVSTSRILREIRKTNWGLRWYEGPFLPTNLRTGTPASSRHIFWFRKHYELKCPSSEKQQWLIFTIIKVRGNVKGPLNSLFLHWFHKITWRNSRQIQSRFYKHFWRITISTISETGNFEKGAWRKS